MPSLGDLAKALLGISALKPSEPASRLPSLGDPDIDKIRAYMGGNLTQLPTTKLRWYLADLEGAIRSADSGDMMAAAQLYRAMRRDGVISGLLGTRSSGLIRLPKTFSGLPDMVSLLQSGNGSRSLFDEMVPPSEAALMVQDGISLGVGIGELVPVEGRDDPILVRLEPEFLRYRWNEGQWYFRSIAGLLPVTPGDGRWVMHMPGGRMSPWQFGAWIPTGHAFITKQHAIMMRANFGAKLANPARVIHSPPGANEPERIGMLAAIAKWGLNSVFELPVGWEASLLESNGRGYQAWRDDEASADMTSKMALAGQVVTADGGTGFINGDLFKSIRADLIQTDGDEWAYTLNTQVLPAFVARRRGLAGLAKSVSIRYETKPPQDAQREATVMMSTADAMAKLAAAAAPYNLRLDTDKLLTRFDLPLIVGKPPEGAIPQAPTPPPPAESAATRKTETELAE